MDTAHRKLFRDGKAVALYAKTFELLCFLAENGGRILTKEEILDAVWEGQFVEEANLSVQISILRKALGETVTAPRFLITVPCKGYKFIAEVRVGNGENLPEIKSASRDPSQDKSIIKDANEKINESKEPHDSKRISTENTDRDGRTIIKKLENTIKGARVGHYEIIEEVGRGGMGEVYQARDTRLNRNVALKLLAGHITEDKNRISRFRQEAFTASTLNHPNIITIYEIGEWKKRDYIVTEFVNGMTLRSFLKKKCLTIGEALDIALQTASALAAAHEAGIIHRDIKPENIMIRTDGLVKILDFGIVKYRPAENGQKPLVETAAGEIIGTAAYMSPEQARGLKIDARTDIWSLGVILYEMVAGELPFPGRTKSDRIAAILEHEPEPLAKKRRRIPPGFEELVGRALAKNKENRFADVSEMAVELQSLYAKTGDEHPAALRLPPRKTGKNIFIYAALAAVLLIAGLGAVYFTELGADLWKSKNTLAEQSHQQLISTFPGSHTDASFSPAGDRIAFVNEADKIPQIWIKDLSGGDPVQVTFENSYANRPRWSPVSDEIIYMRGGQEKPEISLISLENNDSRKIIDGGRNPNWSWDGQKIVFERGFDIWTANKDGSDQRRVDGVPQNDLLLTDRMPALSPNGSQIVFFHNDKGPMGDYWLIPAAGGIARRLTSDRAFGGAPIWMPDGEHIIFPSRRGGSMTLWRIATSGGEPEPVLSSAGEDTQPHVSRDGSKLIYTNTRKTYALMLTDAASGEARTLKESRFPLVYPEFSSDGTRILFFGVNETGSVHIYTIGKDGKHLLQITKGENEENIHPQWSGDGQFIYFYQAHPNVSLRKISVTGGEIVELVKGWEWGTHNHAQVSPDGKRVVYTKMDRGKPVATMIRDIAAGEETAFSKTIRQMRWSHDGQFIAGTDFSSGGYNLAEITICSLGNGLCRNIGKGYRPHWSHDDSQIYFQTSSDLGGQMIWVDSPEGENKKKVADLNPMEPIGQFYAVSPQGEIAWIKYEQSKSELWLVDLSND